MGDRATVRINEGAKGISLYTHWGGYRAKQAVAKALDRGRERWDDAPYLSRIIFCDLIDGDLEGLTGYGIWTGEMDGYEIAVDIEGQTVDGIPFETYIKRWTAPEAQTG